MQFHAIKPGLDGEPRRPDELIDCLRNIAIVHRQSGAMRLQAQRVGVHLPGTGTGDGPQHVRPRR